MQYSNLYTVSQISDMFGEPPQRIRYIISKHRIKPVKRIGIIRLFTEQQAEIIKSALYNFQIRE
jgi:DNA-binding transcriptional MerR regulator